MGASRQEGMITESVVLRASAGPEVAATAPSFEATYPLLHHSAYRVAFRLLGVREEAADIAQESCARAFARWERVRRCDSPEAWVARVAGNLAIDVWRRTKTADKYASQFVGADRHAEVDRVDLHRALETLSRRQRQVVVLRFVADLPEAAVASALGCSVGAVKSHAARGLAALRGSLATEDE